MLYINSCEYPYVPGQTIRDYIDAPYAVCALVNHAVCPLDLVPKDGETIQLLDVNSRGGFFCYRQTLILMFLTAVRSVFGKTSCIVRHSISKTTYCEVDLPPALKTDADRKILAYMRKLQEQDMPILRSSCTTEEAAELFLQEGDRSSADAMRHLGRDTVNLYQIENGHFHFSGVLAVSTGCIGKFDLKKYKNGFLLGYPNQESGGKIPPFDSAPQLSKMIEQYSLWEDVLSIRNVSDLNYHIEHADIFDMILMQEGLHEKKIAGIADQIKQGTPNVKVVLITGPSSSGKTTFASKLGIQLRINSLTPIKISLDNYYLDVENALRDEDGSFNFEDLEAIDYQLFNEHLASLIAGKEVEVPLFSFEKGRRLPAGQKLRLAEGHVLIVEGIHALNEKLTSAVSDKNKFKIYISPITDLSFDNYNPISPTDTRLIRRLVRDFSFRCSSAQNTFDLWPSVQKGEVKNIFPCEKNADVVFNSSIIYEFCVFKRYAEAILRDVGRSSRHYALAQRLLEILSYFHAMDDYKIPSTSLIREFIGGSIFG